jgi:CheY-like chemotaxis protein
VIQAQTGVAFNVIAMDAPVGQTGVIQVEVYRLGDGATIIGPHTDNIFELRPGTYTTSLTVPEAGSYIIRWFIPNGVSAEEELQVLNAAPPVIISDINSPTVDEIGALLRARTQNGDDNEIGTFTSDTRPTDDQVQSIIMMAQSVVVGAVGDLDALVCGTADQVRTQARFMMALLASMLVELSYFPGQIETGNSPYPHYRDMFDAQMPGLIEAAAECRAGEVTPTPGTGDGGGGGTPIPGSASWNFPEDQGGMVGWGTRW